MNNGMNSVKTLRNREVIDVHLAEPLLSLRKLGKRYNISGERVRQILLREDYRCPRIKMPLKEKPKCAYCNKSVPTLKHIYCSSECRRSAHYIKVPCDNCSKQFELGMMAYRRGYRDSRYRGHYFCSEQCVIEFRRGRSLIRTHKVGIAKRAHTFLLGSSYETESFYYTDLNRLLKENHVIDETVDNWSFYSAIRGASRKRSSLFIRTGKGTFKISIAEN